MVTTGESPSRRIEKKQFLDVLNKFGVVVSDEDNQLLDDNLCFELNGQVDYDRFWTELSGQGKVPFEHRKLTPEIIKEWQGYARLDPREWTDKTKTKNEIMEFDLKAMEQTAKMMTTPEG